jgi:hypothetical protein
MTGSLEVVEDVHVPRSAVIATSIPQDTAQEFLDSAGIVEVGNIPTRESECASHFGQPLLVLCRQKLLVHHGVIRQTFEIVLIARRVESIVIPHTAIQNLLSPFGIIVLIPDEPQIEPHVSSRDLHPVRPSPGRDTPHMRARVHDTDQFSIVVREKIDVVV